MRFNNYKQDVASEAKPGEKVDSIVMELNELDFIRGNDSSVEFKEVTDYKKVEKILSELVFISSLLDISDDDNDTMEIVERISKLTRKYKKEIK